MDGWASRRSVRHVSLAKDPQRSRLQAHSLVREKKDTRRWGYSYQPPGHQCDDQAGQQVEQKQGEAVLHQFALHASLPGCTRMRDGQCSPVGMSCGRNVSALGVKSPPSSRSTKRAQRNRSKQAESLQRQTSLRSI